MEGNRGHKRFRIESREGVYGPLQPKPANVPTPRQTGAQLGQFFKKRKKSGKSEKRANKSFEKPEQAVFENDAVRVRLVEQEEPRTTEKSAGRSLGQPRRRKLRNETKGLNRADWSLPRGDDSCDAIGNQSIQLEEFDQPPDSTSTPLLGSPLTRSLADSAGDVYADGSTNSFAVPRFLWPVGHQASVGASGPSGAPVLAPQVPQGPYITPVRFEPANARIVAPDGMVYVPSAGPLYVDPSWAATTRYAAPWPGPVDTNWALSPSPFMQHSALPQPPPPQQQHLRNKTRIDQERRKSSQSSSYKSSGGNATCHSSTT
ncbi:LAMI_0H02696g1_1 [Lachancea mirantina]|uniref:LAMI_0H02696g1_1 n=1 Tax=Lachancea mirantina TaxID=1230905 RepID=A0A1G4KE08_9SACH|nr:LAMI_0H02696g1_1 [Lachancea mirantina]